MPTMADPIVGMWYKHFDKGEEFEVIAVDDDARMVEIQYYDGNVDEMDFYTWFSSSIDPIEAPEDQSAPMDNVETDDLEYSETSLRRVGRKPPKASRTRSATGTG